MAGNTYIYVQHHYKDGGGTFVKGNMMQMMRRCQAGECQPDYH